MDLVLRTTLAFFFILFVMRVTGRRELSSMEPFDLIMIVVLGDLIQQGITQSDYSITGALLVISVMSLLTAFVSFLNARFKWIRPTLEGRPVVLVENGKVIEEHARQERVTTEELEEQARIQQIASLEDVRLAVLETNGQISYIPSEATGGSG
jgi:uncharacterized membrane protein YcaP (DUF421 family)